jgi:hypothetical protein
MFFAKLGKKALKQEAIVFSREIVHLRRKIRWGWQAKK